MEVQKENAKERESDNFYFESGAYVEPSRTSTMKFLCGNS